MDQCLIFTHKSPIKCCNFITDTTLLLITQSQLIIFDVGNTSKIAEFVFKSKSEQESLMPICSWIFAVQHRKNLSLYSQASNTGGVQLQIRQKLVGGEQQLSERYMVVVQGKMGFNHVFTISMKQISTNDNPNIKQTKDSNTKYYHNIQKIITYKTQIHGFCKMCQIVLDNRTYNKYLMGVKQDKKSLCMYNAFTGSIVYQTHFEEQSICESITYIEYSSPQKDSKFSKNSSTKIGNQSNYVCVYIAQQGCKIHKIEIDAKQLLQKMNQDQSKQDQNTNKRFYDQDQQLKLLQVNQSYQIKTNLEIKIINSMHYDNGKLICLLRKSSSIYILNCQPMLELLCSVDCQLSTPRNLRLLSHELVSSGSGQGKVQKVQKVYYEKQRYNIIISDGNQIKKAIIQNKFTNSFQEIKSSKFQLKIQKLTKIHQSKTIQCLQLNDKRLLACGSSGEKQFFYLQL